MSELRRLRRTGHGSAAWAVGVVILLVSLSGCSGEDGKEGETESPSAQASAAADEVNAAAADALVQTGLEQLAAGDRKTARGTFTTVLVLDPDNTLGHYNLGVIEQQTGDEVAAVASYDAALATTPDHVPSLFNKAILLETTDLEAAVALYRTVVDLDDQRAAAFMRLGFALLHLGEREDGEDALEDGIRLDPSMAGVEAPSYE